MDVIRVPYGNEHLVARLPPASRPIVVTPAAQKGIPDPIAEVRRALEGPVGGTGLEGLRGAKSAVIVVSDLTRPVPNRIILPVLLEKLAEVGLTREKLTILIGTGLHRPARREDFPAILGEEVARSVRVISHDASAPGVLRYVGTSSRGTPIWINRHYLEAEARILVGMIDPHQIVGYSGGAKALVIGCGSEATIRANHSHLTKPGAGLGKVEGNPAREDIDEIGSLVGINFILNVVLNGDKEIVKAVAGDFLQAHRAGVTVARKLCEVPVREAADLAIVSPGGFPKDINLYQAQKGLLHATPTVKKGGTIILCAQCRDGVGDDRFEAAMREGKGPKEVIDSFQRREFEMGPHKAYLWCRSLEWARVMIVSEGITAETAAVMKVKRASNLETALEMAFAGLPPRPVVAVLPKAGMTIPVIT